MFANIRGYYFITDEALSKAGSAADVALAVSLGVRVVQYRNKAGSTAAMYREAFLLRSLCQGTKTLFIVNDRIDIALAVDADGVHLGQEDMPYTIARAMLGSTKVIGVTVHSVAEAVAAQTAGADYLGLSPIFNTATKKDAGQPAGIALIREVKAAVTIPITAIGGITLCNALSVVGAGADSLCAISAVVANDNPRTQIEAFQELF